MKEEEHSNQLLLCHICAMYISLIVCNPLIPTDSSKSHLGSDMPSALGLVWFCPRLSSLRKDIGSKNTMSLESSMDGRDTYYAYINGLDKSGLCV